MPGPAVRPSRRQAAPRDEDPAGREGHSCWWERGPQAYLEGLELTFQSLGEALAVLAKLALLGGLGRGVLEPSFQLQTEKRGSEPAYTAPSRPPVSQHAESCELSPHSAPSFIPWSSLRSTPQGLTGMAG